MYTQEELAFRNSEYTSLHLVASPKFLDQIQRSFHQEIELTLEEEGAYLPAEIEIGLALNTQKHKVYEIF